MTARFPRHANKGQPLPPDERPAMPRVMNALFQRLTAASNYMGAARLLLQSTEADAIMLAARNLEQAEAQIIRAAALYRQCGELTD